MPSQKEINRTGQKYIVGLRQAVHGLWVKMCEEDKIPPDSEFVVFSDDNKFMPFYNQALTQLGEAEEQYRAGGYVGLKIGNRQVNTTMPFKLKPCPKCGGKMIKIPSRRWLLKCSSCGYELSYTD